MKGYENGDRKKNKCVVFNSLFPNFLLFYAASPSWCTCRHTEFIG